MTFAMPRPLRGIIPPIPTPLLDRDELDKKGLERLIEHVLAGGVHGVFILGTTGESVSLSHRLRHEFIERTCKQVAGRVPVLVGITDTSFVESLAAAHKAKESGAQAVLLAPPYYFPPGQPELIEYVEHLVVELPLPLCLYNMPSMTKVMYEPDSVRQLLDIEKVVGIKDSSGDWDYFRKIVEIAEAREDWSIWVGPELLLERAVLAGAHGGICAGANINPRLLVDVCNAAHRGEKERSGTRRTELEALGRVYSVGSYASSLVKGVKCALSLMGICDDFVAEPFHRFRKAERKTVEGILREAGLLGGEEDGGGDRA